MLKALTTIIIFLIGLNSCWAENSEAELTFLPKNARNYYVHYGSKVFKPLTEFKVGKKYCLHGSSNWDEACQDAAMKYAYGENWQEYKKVLFSFIEGAKNEEIDKMMGLVSDNFQIITDQIRGDGYRGRRGYGKELYSIRSLVEDASESIKRILTYDDRKYEDFIIKDFYYTSWYNITVSKYITILFDYRCLGENCKPKENIPKILGVYFFSDD